MSSVTTKVRKTRRGKVQAPALMSEEERLNFLADLILEVVAAERNIPNVEHFVAEY